MIEEQNYKIVKKEIILDEKGNVLAGRANIENGIIEYTGKTKLIDFFHEVRHLTQEPASKGSALWYRNEIDVYNYQLELAKKMNAYNDVEIQNIKGHINYLEGLKRGAIEAGRLS